MSTPSSDIDTDKSAQSTENPLSTARVLRAFTGSLMAGTIAILFYKMLSAIATSFANKPVTSDNVTVINLSAAVRTLVLGVMALGTGVFAMAALGLALLGLQMIWQRATGGAIAPDAANSEE
jgi:predicted oxidoreductase